MQAEDSSDLLRAHMCSCKAYKQRYLTKKGYDLLGELIWPSPLDHVFQSTKRLVHEQPPRLDRKPLHQRHHQAPYWDRLTWYRFRLCPLSSTSTPSRSTTPTFPEVPTTCSSMQAGPNLASCVYMYMYLHACIAQIQEDACVYYDKIQHCADVWEGVQIRSGNNSRRSRPQRHHGSDASATTTTTPRARPTASSHKQAIRITSTTSRAAPSSSDHVDHDHVDHVPSSSAELRPRRPRPRRP